MKIVWVGFHMEGLDAFRAVAKSTNFEIVACISLNESQKAKRSGDVDYSSACKDLNISYHEVDHINDPGSKDIIADAKADLLIVLGWSQLLDEEVLGLPSIGTIGAHASLLPSYKGSAPINWALINGLDRTGNTLMWLNPGVDTGDILDQMEFEIDIYDTCETLYLKVADSNREMLLRSLPKVKEQGRIGTPQSPSSEPILARRRPKDGIIDWNREPARVYDFIRALTRPYPGAFTFVGELKFTIWTAGIHSQNINTDQEPGEVVDHIISFKEDGCGIAVACAGGRLLVYEMEDGEGTVLKGRKLIERFSIGTIFKTQEN